MPTQVCITFNSCIEVFSICISSQHLREELLGSLTGQGIETNSINRLSDMKHYAVKPNI